MLYKLCRRTRIVFLKSFHETPSGMLVNGRYAGGSILKAFKYGLTNGPTEGFNNKIRVFNGAATESGTSSVSEFGYSTVHHRIK